MMMSRSREASASLMILFLPLLVGGCAAGSHRVFPGADRAAIAEPSGPALPADEALEPEALVEAVLARNPSLESARQRWRAAAALRPQVTALPDPGLSATLSPGSALDPGARTIGEVMLAQSFPWPGRLRLAGEQADQLAGAAASDHQALQRMLAATALRAYYDLWETERHLELNLAHERLLSELHDSAGSAWASGRGSPQDVLQVELETARLARERLMLERMRTRLQAALNALLGASPEAPLPSPPRALELPGRPLPERGTVSTEALSAHPELEAAARRSEAARVGLRLARLRYYPDLTPMVGYNSMLERPAWRPVVGLALALPLRLGSRDAATEQAAAALQAAEYEEAGRRDWIRLEADTRLQEALEADSTLALYRERLLPTVRRQLEAARTGYRTGRNDFSAVIQAERELLTIEREDATALAAVWRTRAALEEALGRIPGRQPKGTL